MTSSSTATPSGNASYSGNPFSGVKLFVNPYYREEIYNYAIPQLSGDLAQQAAKVAEVPTFAWL
jgi:cellulose 1,4-beta-cellobiosidase